MQKWEYLYLEAYKNDAKAVNGRNLALGTIGEVNSLPGYLNKLGDEGWEIVNSFFQSPNVSGDKNWTFVFKRQKG